MQNNQEKTSSQATWQLTTRLAGTSLTSRATVEERRQLSTYYSEIIPRQTTFTETEIGLLLRELEEVDKNPDYSLETKLKSYKGKNIYYRRKVILLKEKVSLLEEENIKNLASFKNAYAKLQGRAHLANRDQRQQNKKLRNQLRRERIRQDSSIEKIKTPGQRQEWIEGSSKKVKNMPWLLIYFILFLVMVYKSWSFWILNKPTRVEK